MPAAEESRVKKLGVIAGGGGLPEKLILACAQEDIDVFIVGFEGQTDPRIFEGRNHMLTRLGAAGQVINTLKTHQIRDIVLIGSIRRPSLAELKPDMRTARFFARLGMRALGDDDLLAALRHELEKEGFRIHGIQKFAANLLAGEGPVGRCKPQGKDRRNIERGIEIVRTLGRLDVGQAAIIQEGVVLGVEAAEGTDELIRRCGTYKRKGHGGVLVKLCKPQQDMDLDLPTIGPQTVELCAASGLAGIVVEAGKSLLLDASETAALADKHKIFVIGIADTGDLEGLYGA